ncbi:diacylglycerol kinase family protein [Oscillatoria sp. HE19RPO]|uniref:diacylglycerol kinase family protein n=1 Tax=Oscillatoria sp. HE19RPO TaxID=2954806 RepID=UPI0020C50CDA|nr:diacylglycerol kinase family protein [Oscillatoria sp. HE19RPO]
MKIDRSEITGQPTPSVDPSSNLSTVLPMSPEGTTPPSKRASHQPTRFNRDLSWQVATNLFISFKYAATGISYTFQTQRNFRIHVVIGSVAIALGIFLQVGFVEISIITLTIGAVLTMELLNTALESVVDLTVQQSYHDLAKIAKDCAAGAVLISAIVAIAVAGCLLLPPLFTWVQSIL